MSFLLLLGLFIRRLHKGGLIYYLNGTNMGWCLLDSWLRAKRKLFLELHIYLREHVYFFLLLLNLLIWLLLNLGVFLRNFLIFNYLIYLFFTLNNLLSNSRLLTLRLCLGLNEAKTSWLSQKSIKCLLFWYLYTPSLQSSIQMSAPLLHSSLSSCQMETTLLHMESSQSQLFSA